MAQKTGLSLAVVAMLMMQCALTYADPSARFNKADPLAQLASSIELVNATFANALQMKIEVLQTLGSVYEKARSLDRSNAAAVEDTTDTLDQVVKQGQEFIDFEGGCLEIGDYLLDVADRARDFLNSV